MSFVQRSVQRIDNCSLGTTNSYGIVDVRLGQSELPAPLFRQVAERFGEVPAGLLQSRLDDAHVGSVASFGHPTLPLRHLDGASVHGVVTCTTERQEVIWSIRTAPAPKDDVVHMQLLGVFGALGFVLTRVSVPVQHILFDVIEALLWPLLVTSTFYCWIGNPVDVKVGSFDDPAADGQDCLYLLLFP